MRSSALARPQGRRGLQALRAALFNWRRGRLHRTAGVQTGNARSAAFAHASLGACRIVHFASPRAPGKYVGWNMVSPVRVEAPDSFDASQETEMARRRLNPLPAHFSRSGGDGCRSLVGSYWA